MIYSTLNKEGAFFLNCTLDEISKVMMVTGIAPFFIAIIVSIIFPIKWVVTPAWFLMFITWLVIAFWGCRLLGKKKYSKPVGYYDHLFALVNPWTSHLYLENRRLMISRFR